MINPKKQVEKHFNNNPPIRELLILDRFLWKGHSPRRLNLFYSFKLRLWVRCLQISWQSALSVCNYRSFHWRGQSSNFPIDLPFSSISDRWIIWVLASTTCFTESSPTESPPSPLFEFAFAWAWCLQIRIKKHSSGCTFALSNTFRILCLASVPFVRSEVSVF